MCVVRFSCPQLLDVTLRSSQHPVDQKSVGVSTDLGRDPGSHAHQGRRKRLAEPKDPLEARKGNFDALPGAGPPLRRLGLKQNSHLSQGLLESLASVGQISMKLPDDFVSKSRLLKKLFGEGNIRD